MSAYLYTPTKSDIAIWEGWVRASLPLHVKALQDDSELEAKTRARWAQYYGPNTAIPTGVSPLVLEVLAAYLLSGMAHSDSEGARFYECSEGLIIVLLLLHDTVTAENYGWILGEWPQFLANCERIIDRMHSASLPFPGTYFDIQEELVNMYRARVWKKAGVSYDD